MERKKIYLKDYKKLLFKIKETKIHFELEQDKTFVQTELFIHSNSLNGSDRLFFNGKNIEFIAAYLNGEKLSQKDYQLTSEGIWINNPQKTDFILSFENYTFPLKNTVLEGMYISANKFFTQNEAEGFRNITYFPDRPDMMSKFTTEIIANKDDYPFLLANGNKILTKNLPDNKQQVIWQDPSLKPCYLFALVAGDFDVLCDSYTTKSGRTIALEIFVDKGSLPLVEHSMKSLKKAMKWDEDNFGREYDLDLYMIVAVHDFNCGAMENKGLNIFNSRVVLADKKTATDERLDLVENVIAHEYFHNWTGNRITCRDWFQLTLKEGLTVFRDQIFSAEMTDPGIKRISDVDYLRKHQFPEDASPMAHPIKPESYIDIDNFYTVTVYEKGAEVIRMLETILGKDGFRKGMDKYFELYDGQAVTTEDFIFAMSEANQFNLEQFKKWYHYKGTPVLKVNDFYDSQTNEYTLVITQPKEKYMIPFCFGLLDSTGKEIELKFKDNESAPLVGDFTNYSHNYLLTEEKTVFTFEDVLTQPIPSLNRNFSAPVKIEYSYSEESLALLFAFDSDPVNRWDAGQQLFTKNLQQNFYKKEINIAEILVNSLRKVLDDDNINYQYKALILSMPAISLLLNDQDVINFQETYKFYYQFKKQLVHELNDDLIIVYQKIVNLKAHSLKEEKEIRCLKNRLLNYLSTNQNKEYAEILMEQQKNADNFTDELTAFSLLLEQKQEFRDSAIKDFFEKWKDDQLVLTNWFSAQALSLNALTTSRVKELSEHELFNLHNPNMVKALLNNYANNSLYFNTAEGYQLVSDWILKLDKVNPKIAADLARSFNHVRQLNKNDKKIVKQKLEIILNENDLSDTVYEIVKANYDIVC